MNYNANLKKIENLHEYANLRIRKSRYIQARCVYIPKFAHTCRKAKSKDRYHSNLSSLYAKQIYIIKTGTKLPEEPVGKLVPGILEICLNHLHRNKKPVIQDGFSSREVFSHRRISHQQHSRQSGNKSRKNYLKLKVVYILVYHF